MNETMRILFIFAHSFLRTQQQLEAFHSIDGVHLGVTISLRTLTRRSADDVIIMTSTTSSTIITTIISVIILRIDKPAESEERKGPKNVRVRDLE